MDLRDREMFDALLAALPVGVIIVDETDRVRAWNQAAEHFIEAVGRPTLFDGMTLEETHPGRHGTSMRAVIDRLRSGATAPSKLVCGGDETFRVFYNALRTDDGTYHGVAQVVVPVDENRS